MKITYQVSGGITGRELHYELDSLQLANDDQASLELLLKQAQPLESLASLSDVARDAAIHELKIESNEQTYKIKADDTTISAALRQVIRFVRTHSKSDTQN